MDREKEGFTSPVMAGIVNHQGKGRNMGADRDRTNHSLDWAFFDTIYCITLDSRPDRMNEARRQFASVGLEDRVEFVVSARDDAAPARGIYQSHLRCLSRGLEAGGQHILIFEDDIFFRRFNGLRLRDACRFLHASSRWDAFFLGCLTNGSKRTAQNSVVQVRYRCLAHAYVLNRPFAERIVREPWRGVPFDAMLRRCHGQFFALNPMCAFQGLATSDNETIWIDRLRTLFGGLPLIQRGNELYHHNKGLILALHLLITAGAVAVLFFFWQ
jgi:hypothetical protein